MIVCVVVVVVFGVELPLDYGLLVQLSMATTMAVTSVELICHCDSVGLMNVVVVVEVVVVKEEPRFLGDPYPHNHLECIQYSIGIEYVVVFLVVSYRRRHRRRRCYRIVVPRFVQGTGSRPLERRL